MAGASPIVVSTGKPMYVKKGTKIKVSKLKRYRKKSVVSKQSGTTGTKISKSTMPLKMSHNAKIRYAETLTYTTGSGGVMGTANLFLLNSCYDPNNTGTGHQPYGWDQLCDFYTKYRVDKVDVTLICNSIGGSAEVCVGAAVGNFNGNIPLVGMTTDFATEHPLVRTVLVSPYGPSRVGRCKFTVDLAKLAGLSKEEYRAEANYQALTSANPAWNNVLYIAASSYTGTASEQVSVQVILDFHVHMFEQKYLAQS